MLRLTLHLSYIDEPFEWAKLHDENDGQENVYFKSQTPYNYTDAKEYCNRQGDLKSTGVGTHASQLWKFHEINGTLINKEGLWRSDPNITWNIIEKGNNKVLIEKTIEEQDYVLRVLKTSLWDTRCQTYFFKTTIV